MRDSRRAPAPRARELERLPLPETLEAGVLHDHTLARLGRRFVGDPEAALPVLPTNRVRAPEPAHGALARRCSRMMLDDTRPERFPASRPPVIFCSARAIWFFHTRARSFSARLPRSSIRASSRMGTFLAFIFLNHARAPLARASERFGRNLMGDGVPGRSRRSSSSARSTARSKRWPAPSRCRGSAWRRWCRTPSSSRRPAASRPRRKRRWRLSVATTSPSSRSPSSRPRRARARSRSISPVTSRGTNSSPSPSGCWQREPRPGKSG